MTIYQQSLQLLMVEVFKTKNNLIPAFAERNALCNLRSGNHLKFPRAKSTKYGIENIQYIGSNLWASLLEEIKFKDFDT